MSEAKEFVAESEEAATARAASHFGVPAERLEVVRVPDDPPVSGLAGRVLVIAAPRQASEEPTPVGEFVGAVLEKMGIAGVKIRERGAGGERIVELRGDAVEAVARETRGFASSLSHLASRVAAGAAGEEESENESVRVEIARSDRGGGGRDRGDRGDRGDRDRDRGGRGGRDRDRGGRGGGRDRDRGGRGGRDRDRGGRGERQGRGRDRDSDRDRGGERDRDRGGREDDDRAPVDEAALERLSREAASRVRESGEPQLLRPMNSRERWFVHNFLKEERGIRSESEGEGHLRRVKIAPA